MKHLSIHEEDPNNPASQCVINAMKKLPIGNRSFDCSEITDCLYKANNRLGQRLRITPKSKSGEVSVPEKVNDAIKSVEYKYHYIYEYNGYIYDPRVVPYAIPRGDYFKLLKIHNPRGFNLEKEVTAFYGGTTYKGVKP